MKPPTIAEIRAANEAHIAVFGFRSLDELKRTHGSFALESKTIIIQSWARGKMARNFYRDLLEERHFGSSGKLKKFKNVVSETSETSDPEQSDVKKFKPSLAPMMFSESGGFCKSGPFGGPKGASEGAKNLNFP